jgi:hypothetical protein
MTARPFLLLALLAPAQLRSQQQPCWDTPPAPADSAVRREALEHRTAHAIRVTGPAPVMDGRLDDAAWCAVRSRAGDGRPAGRRGLVRRPAR